MGICWCDQLSKDEYLRTIIEENTYILAERSKSTYNSTAPPNSKLQSPCIKEEENTLRQLMDNLNYLTDQLKDTEVHSYDNLKLAVIESIRISASLNKLKRKANQISLALDFNSQSFLSSHASSYSGTAAKDTLSDDLSWNSELGYNGDVIADLKLQVMDLDRSCIVEVSEEASIRLFSS
jgi:cell division protein ZapA (FtsZ GTPase activity inhibitor)